MKALLSKLISRLWGNSSDERSGRVKKNVVLLVVFHALNLVLVMAMVPVSINYLGSFSFGVWSTISSMTLWLTYLDFGVGNGLRNRLSESLALGKNELARTFVSTAYALFLVGSIVVIIAFAGMNTFMNWSLLLKTPTAMEQEISALMVFVIALFALQLFLKLIYTVNNALQLPAINGALSVLINASSLCAMYFLVFSGYKSFFWFGVLSLLAPLIVLVVLSVFLFLTHYRNLIPSVRFVDFSKSKEILNLGMQFFVIQLSGLFMYASQNLVITQVMGPDSVTVYNVVYKYFNLIAMVFSVLLTPFWSAFTEAYVKGELQWIRQAMKKVLSAWALLSLVAVLFIVVSPWVYPLWIGDSVTIPFTLSLLMGIYIILSNWNTLFAYFLNGVGKIRLQLYQGVIAAALTVPLSVLLASTLGWGLHGILITTILLLSVTSILSPLQYKKIISQKAVGIWNE